MKFATSLTFIIRIKLTIFEMVDLCYCNDISKINLKKCGKNLGWAWVCNLRLDDQKHFPLNKVVNEPNNLHSNVVELTYVNQITNRIDEHC